MDDIETTINFSLGKNQTVDDIVNRLRGEAIKETDDGICYSCGGNFQKVTHYSGCVVLTVSEAADEIERLRVDRDRWREIADAFVEAAEIQVHFAKVPEHYTKPWYSQHLKDALAQYQENQT